MRLNKWIEDKSYNKDSIVYYIGKIYRSSIDNNKGNIPTGTEGVWILMD